MEETAIRQLQGLFENVKIIDAEIQNPKDRSVTLDMSTLKPGHRLYEWDVKEGMIQPAEEVRTNVLFSNKRNQKEFKIRDNCHYAPALNAQNAEKRFKKKFGIK